MKNFRYLRPASMREALDMADSYGAGAKPLLGGTDLLIRLNKGHIQPDAIIDLKRVPDIGGAVGREGNIVTVGARVVMNDLVRDTVILSHFPALAEAAAVVGSIQIRNRATIAGNICNASPAADTVPPLMAYGALVLVAGLSGGRTVPLKDFFLGPGKTLCKPSELVVGVKIPVPGVPCGASFGRLTRRRGVDLATINMACVINADRSTTFVFGAVGPRPVFTADYSGDLAKPEIPPGRRDEILKELIRETSPITDVRAGKEYRDAMLLTIGRRVLEQARARFFESVMSNAKKG